jgi:hypothetical protein
MYNITLKVCMQLAQWIMETRSFAARPTNFHLARKDSFTKRVTQTTITVRKPVF